MRSAAIVSAVLLAALGRPARAGADTVFYSGPHPVAPTYVRGMCFIHGPHVHSYVPHKKVLYVKVKRHWTFVGDPVEFEPKHSKHAYYGHHPLFWLAVPGVSVPYCYIVGPHYHWHVPPGHMKFKHAGGVYWFVGTHPKGYKPKHWRARALARHYVALEVHRPVVTVTPPSGFVGVHLGPGGLRAHFGFTGPAFGVKLGPGVHLTPLGVRVSGPGHGRKVGHHKVKIKGGGLKVKGPGFMFKAKGGPRGGPKWHGGGRGKGKGRRR